MTLSGNILRLFTAINNAFDVNLVYKSVSVEEYTRQRKAALGDFLGTVIGGIYEGIRSGKFDGSSDYSAVAKRPHKSLDEMIAEYVHQ